MCGKHHSFAHCQLGPEQIILMYVAGKFAKFLWCRCNVSAIDANSARHSWTSGKKVNNKRAIRNEYIFCNVCLYIFESYRLQFISVLLNLSSLKVIDHLIVLLRRVCCPSDGILFTVSVRFVLPPERLVISFVGWYYRDDHFGHIPSWPTPCRILLSLAYTVQWFKIEFYYRTRNAIFLIKF